MHIKCRRYLDAGTVHVPGCARPRRAAGAASCDPWPERQQRHGHARGSDIPAIDRVPQYPEPGAPGQPELPTRSTARRPDRHEPSTIAQRTFHLDPVFWTCAAIRE